MPDPKTDPKPDLNTDPDPVLTRRWPSPVILSMLGGITLLPWLGAVWSAVPGGMGVLIDQRVPFGELLVFLTVVVVLAVLALASLISAYRRSRRGLRVLPGCMPLATLAMCFTLGLGLAWHNTGLRFGFDAARPELERLAEQGGTLPARAGLTTVTEIARDPRGGLYLKTGELSDMIDTISVGYARAPNPDGTPFGAAGYRLIHLRDGWYAFEASNDWH